MKRSVLFSAFLLPAPAALAASLHYGLSIHDAAWQTSTSRMECRLFQEIPNFGSASFYRLAGKDLAFSLTLKQPAPRDGSARLQSVPPEWQHAMPLRDFGVVPLLKGEVPVILVGDPARRLLLDLEQGMQPTLIYQDFGGGGDEVMVAVSAVNVQKSLAPFIQCLNGLLPNDFADVRSTLLNFKMGSTAISPEGRKRLDEVARYVVADETVKRIVVRGHTDNVGFRRHNRELSSQRAEVVRKYLMDRGVAKKRIAIHYDGEARPVASNRSDGGRARNRRVEITLER